MAQDKTGSLRLSEVAFTNFRTFGPRTVVPLAGADGKPEPVVVFQGDNGTGKSTAVAALDLFFRAAIACLAAGASGSSDAELLARLDLITSVGHRDLLLRRRDRPVGAEGPTELAARFADPSLGMLRIRVEQAGDAASVKLEQDLGRGFVEPAKEACAVLLRRIEAPYGAGSRPLAAMTARRRALWLPEEAASGPLPSGLGVQLYRLRTSLDPEERQRWRAFVDLLGRFEALAGKEISVERLGSSTPQVLVEDPGRSVVPLPDLGSGEQQAVALAAALLLGRGALFAIEKPEQGLDGRHQRVTQELLDAYPRAGFVDQVLIESNAQSFARGLLLRFTRDNEGFTFVDRAPPPADRAPAAPPGVRPAGAARPTRNAQGVG